MTHSHTATHIQIFLFVLLNIILVVVGTIGGFYIYEGYKEKLLLEQNISAAQAPTALPVTVDFGKQISTGSPLIFGGAHYPPLEQVDAWNKIESVGVSSIRVDLALGILFPKNSKEINNRERDTKLKIFQEAHRRGIKVIAIMDYAPRWLTYTNTEYGVPTNWKVYDDLVEQAYTAYRHDIDYLEIWNEPNMPNDKLFLVPNGSGMSRIQAYEKIYEEAATTIRAVDTKANDGKKVPIGAQVSFTAADATFLEPLLKNPDTKKLVDFVSYHHYEAIPSNSIAEFSAVTEKYNVPNMPIFATEWSYSSQGFKIGDIITKPVGITYAASMLMNYFTMGVAGANYHTVTALDYHKSFGIERNHAFYKWDNGNAELLPLAKAWQILSKTMGLGAGKSTIYNSLISEKSKSDIQIRILAFKNADGTNGTVLVNAEDTPQLVDIALNFPGAADWARASIYEATAKTDVPLLREPEVLEPDKNTLKLKIYLSPGSVTGILLKHDVSLPEQIRYRIVHH